MRYEANAFRNDLSEAENIAPETADEFAQHRKRDFRLAWRNAIGRVGYSMMSSAQTSG